MALIRLLTQLVLFQHILQNLDAELAPDDGRDLQGALRFIRQTIDARGQDALQGVGNIDRRDLMRDDPAAFALGEIQAGVPLGITFSFLISAPMVNEVALALLLGLFGWKIAALYLGLGLAVAIVSGWVIGRLKMEAWLEDWVRDMPRAQATMGADATTLAERVQAGFAAVREIVGRVWPYVVAGIAIGAAIHGYVPEDFMASLMGREAWWSVPAAVLIGVPMYANAAGIIPIVEALLAKGAALGTVLAFMMSVIALSLPEMVILRKVLKLRLIAVFAGVVATGILLVGYVFNAVL